MKRHVAIVRPEEEPKIRLGRVALYTRVRQILTAIEAIRIKGPERFTATQVAEEIGIAASAVLYGLYHLEKHKVVECLTPNKQRYREWRVTDWEKVITFRHALESGTVTLEEIQTFEKPSVFQRLLEAMAGRKRLQGRIVDLEDRLSKLEARFRQLLSDLGE